MHPQDTPAGPLPSTHCPDRREIAWTLDRTDRGQAAGQPVTELSATEGVPRSNLYYWRSRRERTDAPQVVRDFFESPDGLEVLHRVYTAAQFVFVQSRGCGVDAVAEFLRLSRLNRFAAASHGSVYQQAGSMERQIVAFGKQEQQRLGAQMEARRIAVCEDETFHQTACLVGMEPVSGYLLVEQYAEKRDAATWDLALQAGLDGLPVEVAVLGSDGAKGLIAHAQRMLGVPHAPDLTHGQSDLHRATARHLAQRVEAPRAALSEAEATTQSLRQMKEDFWTGSRPPGRPPLFDRYIAKAEGQEQLAREALHAVEADRDAVKAAVRGLGDAYHLVDLETGQLQDADTVEQRMRAAFVTIDEIAERSDLSEKRRRHIDKARRLVPKFRAHMAFALGELQAALTRLNLAPAVLDVVNEQLIGGLYLLRAAARARSTEERERLKTLADHLLDGARSPQSPLVALDLATQQQIEGVVNACLDLFVRSTACVEGRNGQLALRHHSLHRLSNRRLAAMTVIHNYHIQRTDGTTAAERLFGQPPEPLFEWLVENLEPPPRPRASRFRRAA